MSNKDYIKLILALIIMFATITTAQVDATNILLTRGKLWQTVQFAKSGPSYSDWSKKGFGLDWPGFDPNWIKENIGGSPSYMVTGGFYVGSMRDADSVLSVEDWALYGSSVSEAGSKYKIVKHEKLFDATGNYWLQENPEMGEEVIESIWEYNENYDDEFQIRRMLPIRVKRQVHQWSGSQLDENYIIHDYTFYNISDELKTKITDGRFIADSLKDFYAMLTYGMHANSRSWNVLFPSLTQGARNTIFRYDSKRKMIHGNAFDDLETPDVNESFGKAIFMGPFVDKGNGITEASGEYLAPAFVGVKLLYSTPNDNGQETRFNQFGWSAGNNTADWHGPFDGIGSNEDRYRVLKDISNAANYVDKPTHELMGKSRMWTMMSFGPYNIAPGDSIRIVYAEIVNGIPYNRALNIGEDNQPNVVNRDSRNLIRSSADRAQFTFDNGFNHPDPPVAPSFTVDFNDEGVTVANVIKWSSEMENIADPDDGEYDLDGYIIYRSSYLPIGPWESIDTVYAGDTEFLNGSEYEYTDYTVEVGASYFYALTAFDTGKDSWPINPNAKISGSTNVVPPMESSIFANRMVEPFVATLAPKENNNEILVVPNPFVIGEGRARPGDSDQIQFVNIPNPCTIKIYTIRGDLVRTIKVQEGDGAIVGWNQVTDFGQFVTSGIYVYHVESQYGTKIGKLAIVR